MKYGVTAVGAGWYMPGGMETHDAIAAVTNQGAGARDLAGVPRRTYLDVMFKLLQLEACMIGNP